MSITLREQRSSSFYFNIFYVEGEKYSGTASGGATTYLASTALTGLVEENIVSSGTGSRIGYYDGTGYTRQVLYDATKDWINTEKLTGNMALTREDTGAVTDDSVGTMYETNKMGAISTTFPTSATAYAIHGFAKKVPTDYTKCFQWRMLVITGGTGVGQVRRIRCVTDDGTTVKIFPHNAFTIAPDNTSTFKICYHPLDLYYADLKSVADGAVGAINHAPTAGGTGYSAGNILTISTGGANAQVKVETVSAGVVTAISLYACGTGYATGAGQITTGGSGSGCTVNVTQIGWLSTYAAWDQMTGTVPLNMELVGSLRVGNSSETYWGYSDFEMIGSGIAGEAGWGTGLVAPALGATSFAYYGDANWGSSDSANPSGPGNQAVLTAITRRTQANGIGNWQNANGSIVKTVRGVAKLAGNLGMATHAIFTGGWGKKVSWHNAGLATGPPRTTRSVGDYGEYVVGGWWGNVPLQTGALSNNAVYENYKGTNIGATTIMGNHGQGWIYDNNYGLSKPYWYDGTATNLDILNQCKNTDGTVCDWWHLSYAGSGHWDLWFERKPLSLKIVDSKSKLPISGATVTIKNARGEVVSYADTGADITADMTDSQTTVAVDLRENLVSNETGLFIDFENISLGTVSGSGAGTLSGITRESSLPIHFVKTVHKYNTAGFDKSIYRKGSATSDANGDVPIQKLVAYSHMIYDGAGTTYASQVTYGGVNYTCNTSHQSSASNIPPNGSYWTVGGTQGFPWRADAQYWKGGVAGKISWTKHGPFSVVVQKAGYKSLAQVFNPTIDAEATVATIEMERPSLSLTDTAKFG